MSLDRHHNFDFDSSSPVKFPNFLNDRYFGQDIQRNFWYQLQQSAIMIKNIVGGLGLIEINGTVVKGTNFDDVNIPESIGIAEFDITVQDETQAWQVPALTKTETLEAIRVKTPVVLDFDISGATLNGSTTNYLKMAYTETDGRTRTKTNAVGSFAFERIISVTITADSTPNTSKEVLLATFIGDGSSFLTITQIVPLGSSNQAWPIGSTYIQFPGDSSPSTLNIPGIWSNVSSELAGDFIRFEGGDASAYDSGQQLDAMQGHWHRMLMFSTEADTISLRDNNGTSVSPDRLSGGGTAIGGSVQVRAPRSDGVNGTPRIDTETRAINRTVRKWRRVA